MKAAFDRLTAAVSTWVGHPVAFLLALLSVLAWAVLGPVYAYSPSWQLVINTTTTIVTFLMVFLLQATQSRDNAALHTKLDGLLIVSEASNTLIAVEQRTAAEIADAAQTLRNQVAS